MRNQHEVLKAKHKLFYFLYIIYLLVRISNYVVPVLVSFKYLMLVLDELSAVQHNVPHVPHVELS